jgi:hypothetical protein
LELDFSAPAVAMRERRIVYRGGELAGWFDGQAKIAA